ncbi:unnamed protein product [Effrenium voratum]|nr:unnamed protein product [Effrenium voratum]
MLVRVGFLVVPPLFNPPKPPSDGSDSDEESLHSETEEAEGPSLVRISAQVAEPKLWLEKNWCLAVKETLQPLQPSPAHTAPKLAQIEEPQSISQAVCCFSGLTVSLGAFEFRVGPVRAEWRERRHEIEEARLAAELRETTVFISSALPHLATAEALPADAAVAQATVSSLSLRGRSPDTEGVSLALQGLTLAATFPCQDGQAVTHGEVQLCQLHLRLAPQPLRLLRQVLTGGDRASHGRS